MTSRVSSHAARAATRLLSLLALGALGLFFLHVNAGIAVDVSAEAVSGGARLPMVNVQIERRSAEPVVRDATELPMRSPIRNASMLEEWARTEGREGLMQSEALDPWGQVMLGRFLGIHDWVMESSERVGNDALWMFQVLASESALDPLAQGPEDGDRGLGQVSFSSEAQAAAWAADSQSPYYVPGFDVSTSVWDPQQNLMLAAIVLRSLYAMPDVTSHSEAYARYTHGLIAVADGRIAARTLPRIERAHGYEDQLRLFFALTQVPSDEITKDSTVPVLTSEIVRDMLAVASSTDPGLPRYLALRDLYLIQDPQGLSLWSFVLQMQEALRYTRLADRVAGIDGGEHVLLIRDAILLRMEEIEASGDAQLIAGAHATLIDATDALAAE